jgi:chemotaxis protein methyltransferase CheR
MIPAPEPRREIAIRPITDTEFADLRDLVYQQAGIFLSAPKKALLVGRLSRRLRELGMETFGAYYRHVRGDPAELRRLLEAICTHETQFFREPRQFDFLESVVFPEWEAQAAAGARPRRIRVWSAGCSTGEEPYSLGMILLSRFGPQSGWTVEIRATDLSTKALARAEAAVWPIEKAAAIPADYLHAFMLRGTRSQQGLMKAGPLLRSVVRFGIHNLGDAASAGDGPYDLIFCRNVLIYFNAESRSRAIHRLMSQLSGTGYLFLGHAETLNGITAQLRSVGPTVYSWAPRVPPAAAPRPRGPGLRT